MLASRTGSMNAGIVLLLAIVLCILLAGNLLAQEEKAGEKPSKLLVVWTSADREVANNMVFMYAFNAKKSGWWKEVRFLVWGPSQKLLVQDKGLQDYLKKMGDVGVELLACKACSDGYGITGELRKLVDKVDYMGVPLTEMLKSGWTVITF